MWGNIEHGQENTIIVKTSSMNGNNKTSLSVRSTDAAHAMAQTEWCVLTGAPGAGKSTIIKELQRRGYQVVPEVARQYMHQERQRGQAIEEIVADQLDF